MKYLLITKSKNNRRHIAVIGCTAMTIINDDIIFMKSDITFHHFNTKDKTIISLSPFIKGSNIATDRLKIWG